MKQPVRAVLLSILLLVFLSACKKSSPQPAPVVTSYMSFKVDGVEHDMTSIIGRNVTTISRVLITGIYQNEVITIDINPIVWPSNSDQYGSINYATDSDITNFYFSTTLGFFGYNGSVVPVKSVIVTSYTSTSIEGTFQCNVRNAQNANPTIKNITEGKFKCVLTQN